MKTIFLISCSSKKLNGQHKAENLYISTLFKLNLIYAKKNNPNYIFILSAKYGLLSLKKKIEFYDESLNKMKVVELQNWSYNVLQQLRNKFDLYEDHFIFLAGQSYRKYLIGNITNYEIPFKGLGIGKQLQKLKYLIDE